MEDPVAITIATYDRAARSKPDSDVDIGLDRERVESFVRRTGRPLPRVLVLGRNLALRCRQIEMCGGEAVGADTAPAVLHEAARQFPQGSFVQGDARSLPVETSGFDGAWTEGVFAHIPREGIVEAMQSVQRALRPGGLLYVRLPLGQSQGFEVTEHGSIYRARWDQRQFEITISALDFTLLESLALPDNEAGLVFRREY